MKRSLQLQSMPPRNAQLSEQASAGAAVAASFARGAASSGTDASDLGLLAASARVPMLPLAVASRPPPASRRGWLALVSSVVVSDESSSSRPAGGLLSGSLAQAAVASASAANNAQLRGAGELIERTERAACVLGSRARAFSAQN
jgi:hypothetical protein